MIMLKVVLKDHYVVLGIRQDASASEIKKIYRKLAREFHPDALGPDASEAETKEAESLFKELSTAYEHLSDPEKRSAIDNYLARGCYNDDRADFYEYNAPFDDSFFRYYGRDSESVEVPEPGQFPLSGIWCWIEFSASPWTSGLRATVTVQLDSLFAVNDLGALPHDAHVIEVIAVDKKGDIVGRSYSLMGLRHNVRRLQAEAKRNEDRRVWRKCLAELEARFEELMKQNKPVGQLHKLLAEARRCINSGVDTLQTAEHRDTVVRAIREVEKEVERVMSIDTVELLLADLLGGKIRHRDLQYNEELLGKLRVYEFRTGGDYIVPTPEKVEAHYRERLQGLKNHDEVNCADLKLPNDEPTILELAEEGFLELAPATVQVRGNKGYSDYAVEYGYVKVDGDVVPAGVITVTESAYTRNGAQHGKKSQFPTLPYGITLLIRVRVQIQDNHLLTAPLPDGKLLQNDVARCRAALRNPKEAEDPLPILSYLVSWPY
jgi:curved DNA-binding protein CbpA